jgi:hypothetical protein
MSAGNDVIFEEEALGKAYDSHLIARLWPYVAPYWIRVVITLGMVVPLFVLEIAPAWIVKTGLDRLFEDLGVQHAVSGQTPLDAWLDAPEGVSRSAAGPALAARLATELRSATIVGGERESESTSTAASI